MSSDTTEISFKCIDRLNQTKKAKISLKVESNADLIVKLNEFQVEVNALMTEIVNNERDAIESKQLTKSQNV